MEPKSYKVRFIEPGLISYEDKNAGTVLVSKEALDRMAPSFKGCPVIFIPELHNDADKTNSFNLDDPNAPLPAGIVAELPVWGDDGWMWVNLLVWDEGAIDAFENKKYNVSCSYITDEEGPAGERNQIPYDAEVVNGHYMHMAIVPRPRYEGSRVFANSKGGPDLGINLFKKKNAASPAIPEKKPDGAGPVAADPAKEPAPAQAEPEKKVLENDDSTEIEVDGVRVPLHELISDYSEKNGGAGEAVDTDPSTLVNMPDGSQKTIQELIDSYRGGPGGDAAGGDGTSMEPVDNSADADADDAKKNGCGAVKANAAPTPRKVNKKLQNAANSGKIFAADIPMTKTERAALGRERYGLGNKKGGE